MRRALVIVAVASMCGAGCGKTPPIVQPERVVTIERPRDVLTPVPVKVKLPAELLAPIDLPPVFFVPPSDPSARVGLDDEGLKRLLAWLRMFPALRDALKAWDAEPLPGETK